jgi:hypothetical protein
MSELGKDVKQLIGPKATSIPKSMKQLKETIFDDILKQINNSEPGFYPVYYKKIPRTKKTYKGKEMEGERTLKATYPSISKRINERYKGKLAIRVRGEELFIEKLKTKKQ